jgi:hypothetical protein
MHALIPTFGRAATFGQLTEHVFDHQQSPKRLPAAVCCRRRLLKHLPARSQQLRIRAKNFRQFRPLSDCPQLLKLLSTTLLADYPRELVFWEHSYSRGDDDEERFA